MRLIDADALTLCNYDLPGMFSFMAVPEETLENAPTINAIEQKHGYWKFVECVNNINYSVCSECGADYISDMGDTDFDNYCYNCGAKMDEVMEDV